MMIGEMSWEDYHHHSHLLDDNEDYSHELNHPSIIDFLSNSVNNVDSERNLSNIEETISINILTKPNCCTVICHRLSPSPLPSSCTLKASFRDL